MSLSTALLGPCLLVLFALLLASPRWARTKAALLSTLLLALSAWWFIDQLSGNGFDAATVYHLRSGVEGAGVGDFSRPITGLALLMMLSLLPFALLRLRGPLLARLRRRRVHAAAVALAPAPGRDSGAPALAGFLTAFVLALLVSPLADDAVRLYRDSRPVDATRVAAEYVVPERALAQRKNIVWIYAESLERTYFDPEVFPDLLPNLTRLAGEGLDFRGIDSAPGGGWTIAGMVSSLCGVPLTAARGDENSMGRMDSFLPGALCLSDYLKQQGYAVRFTGGADSAFAAKDKFLASHGFDLVKDQAYFRKAGVAAAISPAGACTTMCCWTTCSRTSCACPRPASRSCSAR